MITLSARVWHLVWQGQDPLAPAGSPEGRFHHDGQVALYCSLTREGCDAAIRRYLKPDDGPRDLVPLRVELDRVADLRGQAELTIVWQDKEPGATSPTWRFSDRARQEGAQGLIYASRSRPELDHLVLFDLDPSVVRLDGPPQLWQSGLA
jgi:RES domain